MSKNSKEKKRRNKCKIRLAVLESGETYLLDIRQVYAFHILLLKIEKFDSLAIFGIRIWLREES